MEDCCKMGLAKFEQLITESCGSSCIEAKEMHELVNSLRKLRGLTNQLNRSDKETFIKLLFQYFEIVLSYITTTVTEYSMKIQRSSELLSNAVAPFLKDNELNDIIFDSMLKNLFELVLLKGDYATPCTLAIFKLIIKIADQSLEHPRVQKAAANNTYNLLRLADTLGLHGDYVLQLTVIEAIIKFSNSVNKENGYLFFPGNPILNDALLAINLDNFDVYVRRFLNEFNERSPHIFSFPYFSIQIGNTDINSIRQDGNSWIDFNMKEDNLSFYVYNESKTLWNRIIIICDDISKVEIKRASLSVTLRMHQTKPCISLRSEEQHYWEDLERMVEININNEDSGKFNKLINTILPQLFGNKFMHTSNRIAKSSRNDKVYRPIEESKKIFRKTRNSLSADEKYKQKCTSKSPSQFSSANTSWVESSKCPGDNTDNTFSGSESETVVSSSNNLATSLSSAVSDGIEHSPSNVSTDDSIIFPIQSRISGSEKSENQDESRRNNKVFSEDSSSSKSDASSHILRGSVSEGVLVRHKSDTSDDEVILEYKLPSSNEDACDQEINKATSDQVILPPRNDSSSHIPEITENVPLDVTDLPERAIINEEILTAEELEPLYLERSFCSPVSERIEAERPSELITEKNLISPTSANDFSDQVLKNTKNVADERPITIVKEVIPQQELLPSSKKDSCIHVAEKSVVDDRQPEINSEKNASEIVVLPASSEKNSSGSASTIINLQNVSKRKKLYNPNDFSHLEAATSSLEESVEHHESVFLAPKKRTERKKSTKKRTRTESRTKLVRKPKNLNNFPLCIGRANPADIFKAYDSCVPHLVNRDLARLNAIDSAVRYESDEEKGQSANDEFHHLSSISRSVLSALPENDVVTENNDTYIRILDNIKLPSRKRIFNKKDTIEDVQSPNKRSRTDHSSNFDENDRFNFLRGGLRNQDQCARCKTNELGLNILLDVVNHMKQNKSTSLELIDSVLKQLK